MTTSLDDYRRDNRSLFEPTDAPVKLHHHPVSRQMHTWTASLGSWFHFSDRHDAVMRVPTASDDIGLHSNTLLARKKLIFPGHRSPQCWWTPKTGVDVLQFIDRSVPSGIRPAHRERPVWRTPLCTPHRRAGIPCQRSPSARPPLPHAAPITTMVKDSGYRWLSRPHRRHLLTVQPGRNPTPVSLGALPNSPYGFTIPVDMRNHRCIVRRLLSCLRLSLQRLSMKKAHCPELFCQKFLKLSRGMSRICSFFHFPVRSRQENSVRIVLVDDAGAP